MGFRFVARGEGEGERSGDALCGRGGVGELGCWVAAKEVRRGALGDVEEEAMQVVLLG